MKVKNIFAKYYSEIILAAVYTFFILFFLHYYPIPHFTWDSFSYIEDSISGKQGIRPFGYPYFLSLLYKFSHNVHFVVFIQYLFQFCSSLFLINTLKNIFGFSQKIYLLLGVLILIEPIGVYHGNSILSDSLFSSCTIFAISFLLKYINGEKILYLLLHIILMFICIEFRLTALFYPFFSCIILILYSQRKLIHWASITVILVVYFVLFQWHISENKKRFGVEVYSAFSGWTHTNNALYALPRINTNAKFIADEEVRKMHTFFKAYIDSSSFVVHQVGSGYLWDEPSPMQVMRKKIADSLGIGYTETWFYLAPSFQNYGTYIQKNYPYEYIMSFMVPNLQTLMHPHIGEMGNYYCTPEESMNNNTLKIYGLSTKELLCKKQLYKDGANRYIEKAYPVLLLLFVLSSFVIIFYRKRIDKSIYSGLVIMNVFALCFYLLTLYSSWFMYRYLLPLYPMMIASIITTVVLTFRAKLWVFKSTSLN